MIVSSKRSVMHQLQIKLHPKIIQRTQFVQIHPRNTLVLVGLITEFNRHNLLSKRVKCLIKSDLTIRVSMSRAEMKDLNEQALEQLISINILKTRIKVFHLLNNVMPIIIRKVVDNLLSTINNLGNSVMWRSTIHVTLPKV